MSYGTIKVDTVTFTDAGVDKSVSISGLVQNPTFSGNVTVTGTLSGVTVTGTTANFTSGNFTNISGGTHTITSGVFATGSAANPSISFTSDSNTGIYSPGADQVAISTNGTGRLFVDASGRVGIGTTPSQFLHISGSASAYARIDGGSTSTVGLLFNNGDGAIYYDNNTDYLRFDTLGGEKMRLDSSGRLGLGTSSPGSLLTSYPGNVSTLGAKASTGLLIENNGSAGNISQIGLGYTFSSTYHPVAIAAITDSGSGSTRADLHFATRSLTTDTAPDTRMIIKSDGKVGVGITSPAVPLHVSGDGNSMRLQRATYSGTGETVSLDFRHFASNLSADYAGATITSVTTNSFTAGGGAGLFDAALTFSTLNDAVSAERLRITSDGKVGVGTTTPGGTLDIKAAAATAPLIVQGPSSEFTRVDDAGRLLVGTSSARSNVYVGSTVSTPLTQVNTATNTYNNGLALINYTASGYATWLTIGSSGSNTLGTNTATPGGYQIGGINFVGNDGTDFRSAAFIVAENDQAGAWASGDCPGRLVFSTTADGASSPTERMRIDSAGILKASNNNTYAAGSYHQFNQNASSQWTLGALGRNSVDPYGIRVEYTNAAPNGTVSQFLYCVDTVGVKAEIRSNGGLANYSANNANLSDRNAKKDISLAADTWDCIKEWEIVNYRYKDQPDDTDLNLGVIAQQVAESCPEVITVFEEARNGQPEKLGVKEQQMYWMAIKALQEAQMRIETLEAKVAALEIA